MFLPYLACYLRSSAFICGSFSLARSIPSPRSWTLAPLAALLLALSSLTAQAEERWQDHWSGYFALEPRFFLESPAADARQGGDSASFSFQPQYFIDWDGGRQSFAFVPFLRLDSNDSQRTHADIRELTWAYYARDWELRAGVRKVFWGVAESQHLVDIINQTDLVEAPDGEDKLGQLMLNVALINDWGTWDIFLLPGFRERTFPGAEGRLRTQPRIDPDLTTYESSAGEAHIDFAVRWTQTFGDWDIGLSHFWGTSREPTLAPAVNGSGETVLAPHYEIIHQTGIDAQLVDDGWLWKLEAIHRSGQGDANYWAAAFGFEYTFVGIADTAMDFGFIAEVLYDERGDQATTPFERDLMLGGRFAFNDAQSTEVLLGVIQDFDSAERSWSIEASRRLGERWKISVEGRWFSGVGATSPLHAYALDDYIQVELACYF